MNTTYIRIKDLADAKGISIAELERTLNFSSGLIGKWKNAQPSSDRLIPIADYFDVTTDYLLGRNPKGKSDPDEYFRIDTTGLDDAQSKKLRKQMDDYMAFARQQLKKED